MVVKALCCRQTYWLLTNPHSEVRCMQLLRASLRKWLPDAFCRRANQFETSVTGIYLVLGCYTETSV